MGFTNKHKLQTAQRELEMRRRVYPRLVSSGKMTDFQANRELAIMQDIVNDYQALVDQTAPQTKLDL